MFYFGSLRIAPPSGRAYLREFGAKGRPLGTDISSASYTRLVDREKLRSTFLSVLFYRLAIATS